MLWLLKRDSSKEWRKLLVRVKESCCSICQEGFPHVLSYQVLRIWFSLCSSPYPLLSIPASPFPSGLPPLSILVNSPLQLLPIHPSLHLFLRCKAFKCGSAVATCGFLAHLLQGYSPPSAFSPKILTRLPVFSECTSPLQWLSLLTHPLLISSRWELWVTSSRMGHLPWLLLCCHLLPTPKHPISSA